MSGSIYSYITSISRVFKSQIITNEFFNEIINEKELKNVINILKNKGFLSEEPKDLSDIEWSIRKRGLELISKLSNYSLSSRIVEKYTLNYFYILTIEELRYVVNSVYNNINISFEKLHVLNKYIDSQPKNLEELSTILKGTIFGEALSFALSKGSRDISAILSLLDYFFVYNLNRVNQELGGDVRTAADQLICGYKDYYTLLLAYRHKIQVDTICKLTTDMIREAYSATRISELIDILKRSYYAQYLDFSEPYNTLESMYIYAKINARKRAISAFMGTPFTPLTALGILELIRLTIEDLISIVNGIKLGLQPEKIRKFLSIGQ